MKTRRASHPPGGKTLDVLDVPYRPVDDDDDDDIDNDDEDDIDEKEDEGDLLQ